MIVNNELIKDATKTNLQHFSDEIENVFNVKDFKYENFFDITIDVIIECSLLSPGDKFSWSQDKKVYLVSTGC